MELSLVQCWGGPLKNGLKLSKVSSQIFSIITNVIPCLKPNSKSITLNLFFLIKKVDILLGYQKLPRSRF